MDDPPSGRTRSNNTSKYLPTCRSACDKKLPCAFCRRSADDELIYGKFYAIGDIQCHYSCMILSTNLHHRGESHEGLHGYLYNDILEEIERSKDIKCSYCGKGGATLCCDVHKCNNDFHFSCAKERHAVFVTCGKQRTFCEIHAPNHDSDKKLSLKLPSERNASKKVIDSKEGDHQGDKRSCDENPKKMINLDEYDCAENYTTLLAKRRSKNILKTTNILKRSRRPNFDEHDYANDSNDFLVARYSVNVDSRGTKGKCSGPRKRQQKESPGQHIVLDDDGTEMFKEVKIGRKTKFVSQDRKKKVKPIVQPSKPDIKTIRVSCKDKLANDLNLNYEVLEREDDCNILILKE